MSEEEKKHRKFLVLFLALSSSAFLFVLGMNWMVDPFNMNARIDLGLSKKAVSGRMNVRLFKIIEYARHPEPNLWLGDSRTASLDVSILDDVSDEKHFNFAFGGGSIEEALDAFDFADGVSDLKNVYFGVNFNIYNDRFLVNGVREAIDLHRHPIRYYTSFFVTKASVFCLAERFTGKNFASRIPNISKEQFWALQLGPSTDAFYRAYKRPDAMAAELRKLKTYCDANSINLVFFIPPQHVDLQMKVDEYGLARQYEEFKRELASISTTIDFDFPNEFTEDKSLYIDPYHFNEYVKERVLREVYAEKPEVGKKLNGFE